MKIKHYQAYACVILLALVPASPSVRVSPPREANRPMVAGDEFWANQFDLGVIYSTFPDSSTVTDIAVSGTNVYVGGYFDHAGNVAANNIARWDSVTHRWSALGSGVNNWVYTVAAHGNDVYVGGPFTTAGGISVTGIAHWNEVTQTWSAVGGVLERTTYSPYVETIAIGASDEVYVGGLFDKAGGVTVNNIARWDGSSWHALGGGTGGNHPDVGSIATSSSDVYIGGSFTTVDGLTRNHVAHWNGSAWSGLGGGTNADVEAVVIDGSNVYIGGVFTTVTDGGGDHPVGYVAMWNGYSWSTMGGGVGNIVRDLALGPDGLYVGGEFTTWPGGSGSAQHLARWDGSNWHILDGGNLSGSDGVDNNVLALAVMGNQVYLGGMMHSSKTGRVFNHIGYWDTNDAEWYALGNSVNGAVYALAIQGEDIYLGGSFTSAGGVDAPGIARWNPRTGTWSEVGGGVSGCTGPIITGCAPAVYALLVDGEDIYVGGNFTHVGGQTANGIARWDVVTQTWDNMDYGVSCSGLGCSAYVRALAKESNWLLLGGNFDYVDSYVSAYNVAAWDGYHYSSTLGSGTNGTVYTVQMFLSSLYIGGSFTSPENYIARWNAGGWYPVGNDLNNKVRSIAWSLDLGMFVGGSFTNAGGDGAADRIARLGGTSWAPLGDGFNDSVYALDLSKDTLFAGGAFTSSGTTGMNRIARWDGSNWSGLGSGTDNTVLAVAYVKGKLYVGGDFHNAGGKPSYFFGGWGPDNVYLPLVVR
jgi:hypothetical protein